MRVNDESFNMAECLDMPSTFENLLSYAAVSESLALGLASDLTKSLQPGNGPTQKNSHNKSRAKESTSSKNNTTTKSNNEAIRYPIELPNSLQFTTGSKLKRNATPVNSNVDTGMVCAESILASLSKIADGGSKASSEMRMLEMQRSQIDKEVNDISNALTIRELSQVAAEALSAQRYKDAAEAVAKFRDIEPSQKTIEMAGKQSMRQFIRTQESLQKTILSKYESAVMKSDLGGLSSLTPLLGTLKLAEKGVALYLRYSRDILSKNMEKSQKATTSESTDNQNHPSNPNQQVQPPNQVQTEQEQNVCAKLAKVFNSAVTHLRHHLPMVARALGDADGDAALVQLVHLEVEKRAIKLLKEYSEEKKLSILESKSTRVISRIEDKYINGEGLDDDDGNDSDSPNYNSMQVYDNDCGFVANLGKLAQVDQTMDETALALQHTESYERFIRHAVDQVLKARELRAKLKLNAERKKKEEATKANGTEAKEEEKNEAQQQIEILPTNTQLNEIVAEIGGYYSGLERVLLLGSMQRAFLGSLYNLDDRSYSPISVFVSPTNSGGISSKCGSKAIQTSIVEECLYAAQRSTMRAFATGHTGTACAAANFCSDSLGRALLEVLARRAEKSTSLLKPGEGLLIGTTGLGQAALAVMNSAQKGLRSKKKVSDEKGSMSESFVQNQRLQVCIARACAPYNDIEVAADYTKRLEAQFLSNIDSTFPPGTMTEQLRMCIKSLSPVYESLKTVSTKCVEQLVTQLLPRVRTIVSDAVAQDNPSGSSFMKSGVIGGNTSNVTGVKMNYDLDEQAYELLQISEGYMSKM